MAKVKIILEVDADDLDWGSSSVVPVDVEAWGQHYDIDLDVVKYDGQAVEFADVDEAADYLIFLYGESDIKDHQYA